MTTPPSVPPPYGQQPVPPPYGQPVPPPGYPGYPMQPGTSGAPARPPRQPVQVWDVVLTIVFLIGLLVLTAIASFAGLFLVMASDPCGVRDCSIGLITAGWIVGTALPWLVLIAAAIVSIVFMVKRRIAFYIPLLGAVGVVCALMFGFLLAGAGVPTG